MKQITSKFNDYFKEYKLKSSEETPLIKVDETVFFQTHLGFGGAFTDAACSIFLMLDEKQKDEVIKAYFSLEGLNYNLGRMTIGSCDFSRFEYDYIKDYNGEDFALNHDKEYIFEFLKRANKENKLTLMASSWSAPKMYKTNFDKCHGGYLKKECYSLYAKYMVNYIKHMSKEGFDITYLTIQNEPEAVQTWESCIFTPQEEFALAKCIYKELKTYSLDTKLLLWDHNRDSIVNRVKGYYEDKDADDNGFYDNLTIVHNMCPNKHLFFTEGCIELLNLNKDDPKSASGTMQNALRYAKNYIMDSLNYSEAFIDWNLLLNEHGGPNHVGNYCEALIMFDKDLNKLIYNPSYYVVKHFAHFIKKGAKRIKIENESDILATSYLNPNNEVVVILSNEKEATSLTLEIKNQKVLVELPAYSITTIIC